MDAQNVVIAKGVAATKYSRIASLTFLLYDYALTFGPETEFVWSRRWSFGKALFIFNRYFGLFTLIFDVTVAFQADLTAKFCEAFFWWELVSGVIGLVSVEIILQARIYAVYNCNRKLLAVMVILCCIEIASEFLAFLFGIPSESPPPGLTGCYPSNISSFYWFIWVPGLVYETFLCFLMLYKARELYKNEYQSSLLRVVMRDSFVYFFTSFAVLLLNCLLWALHPEAISDIALDWAIAIFCAIGSRLLLNMRERVYKGETTFIDALQGGMEMHSSGQTTLGISFSCPAQYVKDETVFSSASTDRQW